MKLLNLEIALMVQRRKLPESAAGSQHASGQWFHESVSPQDLLRDRHRPQSQEVLAAAGRHPLPAGQGARPGV